MDMRRKKGYSLTEVIVSMALIVLVSVTAFMVCYVGINAENNSDTNMQIFSSAETFRKCFEHTIRQFGKGENEEEKDAFLEGFNDAVSFSFGADISEPFANETLLGGEWKISAPAANTGFRDDGTPKNGLSAYYYGADRAGATYAFEYEAFAALSRVLCRINLRSNVYYVTIEGYLAGSEKAAYLYTEQY